MVQASIQFNSELPLLTGRKPFESINFKMDLRYNVNNIEHKTNLLIGSLCFLIDSHSFTHFSLYILGATKQLSGRELKLEQKENLLQGREWKLKEQRMR